MSDFSIYNGPSEEWLAVQATLPALHLDPSTDPKALQAEANATREETATLEFAPLAALIQTSTFTIPTRDNSTIQARSYRPIAKPAPEILPVYVYFHGGGFLMGTLDSEDAICARHAINLGIVVLNVNYRHTPEFSFPVAWEDTQDAFAWLHANAEVLGIDPEKVVVGGISAGGQLSASLVLEKHLGKSEVMKGLPAIAGQVLMIPCLASVANYASGPLKKLTSPDVSSYVSNEHAPLLPKSVVHYFSNLLGTAHVALNDTKINIVNAEPEEVRGLPPTVFGIAGLDPLRDEGLLYAKMLAEEGVATDVRLFKGVPHAFRRFGDKLKASAEWDKCVEEGILWALGKPVASGKFEVKVV